MTLLWTRRVVHAVAALGCMALPAVGRAQAAKPNELTAAERAAGWQLLFDGKTLTGWRGIGYDSIPTALWKVDAGAIHRIPKGQVRPPTKGQPAAAGDLMTIATYDSYELAWDWKIGKAGNSGLKYNVSEELSILVATNHAALGFEYQLLDDSLNDDNKIPSHLTGSLYDMIPAHAAKIVHPVGDWNSSRLVVRGRHVEHWLNGKKVVEFDIGSAQFDSLLRASKCESIKDFARPKKGHIALQDHGGEIFFRSVKIRATSAHP